MNPHQHLFDILKSNNFDIPTILYGEKYYNDKIFDFFISDNENIKGGFINPSDYPSRFRDIISDPNNLFIKRDKDAGKVENGVVTLHNGIKIYNEYYSNFVNILRLNLGVHEPSEERAFKKVLDVLEEGSTMVELGSYWSMYSVWFMKEIKNSTSYCIEPGDENIKLGIKNFELNNLKPNFTKAFISKNGFNLLKFILEKKLKKLDILHSDIQGHELEMLHSLEPLLNDFFIKYIFISSHSNKLHYDCIDFLKSKNYKILCSCDFDYETFQYDGFLLACPNELNEISEFETGNRKKSKLISQEYLVNFLQK